MLASDGSAIHACALEATRTRGRFSLFQGSEAELADAGKLHDDRRDARGVIQRVAVKGVRLDHRPGGGGAA